jgi:hypothetical protein
MSRNRAAKYYGVQIIQMTRHVVKALYIAASQYLRKLSRALRFRTDG